MVYFIYIGLLLFLNYFDLHSQNYISYKVEWVKNIDNNINFKENKTLLSKIGDFITGAPDMKLIKPYSLVALDTNRFFILDHGYKSPLYIDLNKGIFEVIESENDYYFPSMNSICLNEDNIYFTDSKNNTVYKINKEFKISIFIDSLYLKQPTGVIYNPINNEFAVTSTGEHQIKFFDKNGKFQEIYGKRSSDSNGFNYPTFLSIDKNGNTIILDNLNYNIKILDRKHKLSNFFGEQGDLNGYLLSPKGLDTDSNGNIFIADALLNTIQVFNQSGEFLINFGCSGNKNNEFNFPTDVFIDDKNYIYVSDYLNSRIQIFRLEEVKQ